MGTLPAWQWNGHSVFDANAHRAKRDNAGGQIAEIRDAEEQPDVPRDAEHFLRAERVGDDSLLRLRLEKLDEASGPFAFALNFF